MDLNIILACIKSMNSIINLGNEILIALEVIGEVNLRASISFLENMKIAKDPEAELRSAVTTLIVAYESLCKSTKHKTIISGLADRIFHIYVDKHKNTSQSATELSLLIYVIYLALNEYDIADKYLKEAEEWGSCYFKAWGEQISIRRVIRSSNDIPMPEDDLDDEEEMLQLEKEKFAGFIKQVLIIVPNRP